MKEFCKFVNDLEGCLGKFRDSCVSPNGFEQLGVKGEDVYDYPTNYGIIEYTCGAGLPGSYLVFVYLDHFMQILDWNKIIKCTTANAAAINAANTKCEKAFEATNQTCTLVFSTNLFNYLLKNFRDEVTFLECTYVLLKKDCGQDAYDFACAADTNGIRYSTPDCLGTMINCNPTSTTWEPSTSEYVSSNTAMDNATTTTTTDSSSAIINSIAMISLYLVMFIQAFRHL